MEYSYRDEFYHHGILGQKWGVQNGPPYPLDTADHSVSEKKAGWKKSLDSSDNKVVNKKDIKNIQRASKEASRQQAKELLKQIVNSKEFKVGAIAAVSVLAAYGAYKLGTHFQMDAEVVNGVVFKEFKFTGFLKEYYDDIIEGSQKAYAKLPQKFNSIGQLPKSAKNYADEFFHTASPDAASKLVAGINHGADIATNNLRNQNCGMCSAAIIARLKGYEITAAEMPSNGLARETLEGFFEGGKFLKSTTSNSSAIVKSLVSKGEGTYGIMYVPWKVGGAHYISYAVKNGTVEFLDGQIEKVWDPAELFSKVMAKDIFVMDCTSCNFTDYVLKCFV